jgi:ribosomal protein S18 acetylase RimI-like enzyme
MINTQQINNLPRNMGAFIQEIGAALAGMYGPAAEMAYRHTAEASYSRMIQHPDVRLFACDSNETSGLLISFVRDDIAHITLLHVLEGERGKGIEDALLDAAIKDLRDRGMRAVIGEFVRYCPINLEEPMTRLGFSKFDRQLMIADLEDQRLMLDTPAETSPCGERDRLAAGVLVDAYRGHPSRQLHPEAHDEESALTFLEVFRANGFGAMTPSLYRLYVFHDECQGMITGAEAAPDIGFILHVATRRSIHGKGVGSRLIREVAEAFRDAGYRRIALGVTCGNPAERLYERLGFNHLIPVETYAWWAAQD